MKIAVVGVTGMVGQVMLRILEERNLNVSTLIPVASEKSVGTEVTFKNKQYKVVSMKQAIEMKPDIALFSAGGSVSLEFAPQFAKRISSVFVLERYGMCWPSCAMPCGRS